MLSSSIAHTAARWIHRTVYPLGCCALGVLLNISNSEAREIPRATSSGDVSVETLIAENKTLHEKLVISEACTGSLQKQLALVSGEAEVFKRIVGELNVRLEALGTQKIDERLLQLLTELRVAGDERTGLRESMMSLSEAVLRFKQVAVTDDSEARLDLEAGMRRASQALGNPRTDIPRASTTPTAVANGMVIGVKDELALIVSNVGSRQGVKVGMPFHVIRGETNVGLVRIVDVREKLAGALIQTVNSGERIRVGDHLKIAINP